MVQTEQQLKFCAESIQTKLEETEREKQQLIEENKKNNQVFFPCKNLILMIFKMKMYKKEVDNYKSKYESAMEELRKIKAANKNDLKRKMSQDFDSNTNLEKLKNLECFYNEIKRNQRKALSLIDPNLLKKLQDFEVFPYNTFSIYIFEGF